MSIILKESNTFFTCVTLTGHVHHRKPGAPICSEFLLGKCRKGKKCSAHHCSLPYHWQYRVGQDDVWKVWKSFSEADNEKLEKLYCDVMLEECSATGFQLSFERQVVDHQLDKGHCYEG